MNDYLIVGFSLYGTKVVRELTNAGKSVLVIDKPSNIAGKVNTKDVESTQKFRFSMNFFKFS